MNISIWFEILAFILAKNEHKLMFYVAYYYMLLSWKDIEKNMIALYSTKVELLLKINILHCIIYDITLMSKKSLVKLNYK